MTNEMITQEAKNEFADLTSERIDNLAALVTVSAEQMEDRLRADELLADSAHRTDELMALVFGGDSPSVENYLAAKAADLQAA